jgi:hypothetical protein
MCQTHTQNNETSTYAHCGHDHEYADGRSDESENEDVTGAPRTAHRCRPLARRGRMTPLVAVAAGVVAEGHGPGRNPWWVNVSLVLALAVGVVAWRIRVARRKRADEQSEHEQGLGS